MKALSTIANEGKVVWIKVISVRSENGKTRIGCSMKHVDQEDGSDLDPNNIQLEQQSSQPAPSQVEHYKVLNHLSTMTFLLIRSSSLGAFLNRGRVHKAETYSTPFVTLLL